MTLCEAPAITTEELETLRVSGCGLIRAVRHGIPVWQRLYSMRRVHAALRRIESEKYAQACALGGDE